ncbi:MAG: triose-phosphate isomerase, partial [Dehalococcoidia bacterium]|nr:triose-phosphate isomerase [Dehalococcoidia bacterium]
EISSQMLGGICKYVILGHSERRQLLGETSDSVNAKMNSAIANGITPIVCIGETLDDRNAGKAKEVVLGQLEASISGIGSNSNLAIAYEPLWAIGTGIAATSDDAEDMMSEIRDMLSATLGNSFSNQVSLLYGGSVNSNNIGDYITQKNINGVLVGGASLDPNAFVEIARAVSKA